MRRCNNSSSDLAALVAATITFTILAAMADVHKYKREPLYADRVPRSAVAVAIVAIEVSLLWLLLFLTGLSYQHTKSIEVLKCTYFKFIVFTNHTASIPKNLTIS